MKIDEVLTRGVDKILPSKKGLASLMGKKKITLYQGFDPSSDSLHIGHLIGIRKLAQFQKLGHKVIFLIGDFTGTIGDPTDKTATRIKLTHKKVLENARGYKKQVSRVLRFDGSNPAKILYNSTWLSKLKFEDILNLASSLTVQQMLERDFFQDRIKNDKPIGLHEFLYPLMVGYDCINMDVDLEIGGSDQLFNMMAGRSLMKAVNGKQKYVLTMKLFGLAGGKKMSKSNGITINLSLSANKMFGALMSLADESLKSGIELLTDLPLSFSGKSPMGVKKRFALEVVSQVHGNINAKKAQEEFERTFQERKPQYKTVVKHKKTLLDLVSHQCGSKSESKRLIAQGAVDVNGKSVKDPKYLLIGGEKIKIGKTKFVKVGKN